MLAREPLYCPICRAPLVRRLEGGRLRPACDQCGYVHFVNPVPGVGIVIEAEGGIVLIQRGHPPHKGEWALPSGFVEADERAEQAAIREAEEETGLKVTISELLAINSFPEGPPVSGIMIFYRATPAGGALVAGDDAAAVKIFQPHELPLLPFRTHRETIALWLDQRRSERQQASLHAPEISIRPLREADLDQVVALLELIPANRSLTPELWTQVRWRMRESDTVEVVVAEWPGTPALIIGCASLSVVRGLTENVGLIGNMAVLPTYQRRGVGGALLKAMMTRAAELNLAALWVDKTRANDQARAFYTSLGFGDLDLLRMKL